MQWFRIPITIFLLFAFIQTNGQMYFEDKAGEMNVFGGIGHPPEGGGVTVFDYNHDGWDDITLATDVGNNIRFYKNVNGIFFLDFLNLSPLTYRKRQVNWVDFDNDGDSDLFVTSDVDKNRLLENDGSFNFTDITNSAGFPDFTLSTYGSSWGDYDNDGDLDVFLSNKDPQYNIPNLLYKNNGDGTFTDVSFTAGIHGQSEQSFCSAFFDYNNDGWQDIYVSNDRTNNTNVLYHNNGDGTFSDVSEASGTDLAIDAMTVTVGDYNSDGWFDLYITNSPPGNVFLKNNGDGTFSDITEITGTSFNSIGWGAVFLDAENDTDLDLYVSSSTEGTDPGLIPSAMYENLGNDLFNHNLTAGFVGDNKRSYSNATGDFNNDGLQDITVANILDEPIFIWVNNSSNAGNWLGVTLEGVTSNKDGIGSVIEIGYGEEKQYRYTHCGEGYLSQNSQRKHFGLGSVQTVDYLKVSWLSGTEDYYFNIDVNQTLNLVEGQGTLSLSDHQIMDEIIIWPNPVNDKLNINFSSDSDKILEIIDLTGKQILRREIYGRMTRIPVSDLNSGYYFVKITYEQVYFVRKLLKK